ncbi:hypothetical protein GQ457_13G005920 [Hibiscus cannabinus]
MSALVQGQYCIWTNTLDLVSSFFCSDRDYIIGLVPYPGLPKRDKPRRVELYFSSWIIRSVESRKGDGQLFAWGSRKTWSVRRRMWRAVKKLHSGMRAYQNARKTDTFLSRCALIAGITTKIHCYENTTSAGPVSREDESNQSTVITSKNDNGLNMKSIAVAGIGFRTPLRCNREGIVSWSWAEKYIFYIGNILHVYGFFNIPRQILLHIKFIFSHCFREITSYLNSEKLHLILIQF